MNWNQYRVGTRLQRVHTDCLGRKFSPQRSQYTVTLPVAGIQASDRRQLTAFAVPKTTGQRAVLVSVVFLAQKFGLSRVDSWSTVAKPAPMFSRVSRRLTLRSTKPGRRRSRFPALILQLVQLLFQIRFAFLQIFQLAVPVVDVRDVVFHPVVTSKPPLPNFLISSFFCAICSSVCAIASRICRASRARTLRCSLLRLHPDRLGARGARLSSAHRHHGYAGALHPGQIIFRVHLGVRRSRLFCFAFAGGFRERIFFLRRLVGGCGCAWDCL